MLSKESHHPNVCINLGVKHWSPIALHFNSTYICLLFSEILVQICVIYPDYSDIILS